MLGKNHNQKMYKLTNSQQIRNREQYITQNNTNAYNTPSKGFLLGVHEIRTQKHQ